MHWSGTSHEVLLLVLTAWHGLCNMVGGKRSSALTAGPNGGQASPGHAPPLRGSGFGPIGGILHRAEQARRKLAMMAVLGGKGCAGVPGACSLPVHPSSPVAGPRAPQWWPQGRSRRGPQVIAEGRPAPVGAVLSLSLSLGRRRTPRLGDAENMCLLACF